ncbi:MAG: hypothetical protein AABY22_09620 [Nanoarchaeota archaeon]
MEEEDIEFKINKAIKIPVKLKTLLSLNEFNTKELYTILDIEKRLGYRIPQTEIRKIALFLIENKILQMKEKIYHIKRYELDRKLLRKYIDALLITKLFYQYFKNHPGRFIL